MSRPASSGAPRSSSAWSASTARCSPRPRTVLVVEPAATPPPPPRATVEPAQKSLGFVAAPPPVPAARTDRRPRAAPAGGEGARRAPAGTRGGVFRRRQHCGCAGLLRARGGSRPGGGRAAPGGVLRPCRAATPASARRRVRSRAGAQVVRARARARRPRGRRAAGQARRQLTRHGPRTPASRHRRPVNCHCARGLEIDHLRPQPLQERG